MATLQIDDFEHHQSWRIEAVAGMWKVPSHFHRADLHRPLMSFVRGH
jgi:hypothetical protein